MTKTIETEDIKLPDGHVWTVKRYLSRGDRRHIDRRVFHDQMRLMGEMGEAGISLDQITGSLGAILGINVKNADAVTENAEEGSNGATPTGKTLTEVREEVEDEWSEEKVDATIERATVSWTYEGPVTVEAITETEEYIYDVVAEAVKGLYQSRPVAVTENLEQASPTA